MAKKQKLSRRARQLGKHAARYAAELAMVRKIFSGFDAKKFERAQVGAQRGKKAQGEARKLRMKVRRRFESIKGYVNQAHKVVRIKDATKREALREALGVKRLKHLRAVPFATQAKKVRVRFTKDGRPLISEDGVRNTYFLFPRVPKAHSEPGPLGTKRFIDAQDDAVAMLKDMLPTMRPGYYVFLTRHHFLIPMSADRDRLASKIRELYSQYSGSPEFLKLFVGFRYLTDSEEVWARWQKEATNERARQRGIRRRARVGRRLKEILAMDKQLKEGRPLSRGQISRRAKITGRR